MCFERDGFLFVTRNGWSFFSGPDEVSTGNDIEKAIFNCRSLGVTILDARTTRYAYNPPTWQDYLNDFARFREIGVYIGENYYV